MSILEYKKLFICLVIAIIIMGKKLIESGKLYVKNVLNKFKGLPSDTNKELLENLTPKKGKEVKESKEVSLQKVILAKPHMTAHHRAWLEKKTDKLVAHKDILALEQIKKSIDFAEGGKLVIHTHTKFGTLTFASKQATFNDIYIPGIEKNKNIWTENKVSHEKGLWANHYAIENLVNAGKKICTDEQFIAAANAFPGGNVLQKGVLSTKVEDFFDLLGVTQFSFRNPAGNWAKDENRYLWSSSGVSNHAFNMKCNGDKSRMDMYNKYFGFGIWFIEG